MRSFILWLQFTLPKWVLRLHRDPIGERTWATWFRLFHFGWKRGEKLDRVQIWKWLIIAKPA